MRLQQASALQKFSDLVIDAAGQSNFADLHIISVISCIMRRAWFQFLVVGSKNGDDKSAAVWMIRIEFLQIAESAQFPDLDFAFANDIVADLNVNII